MLYYVTDDSFVQYDHRMIKLILLIMSAIGVVELCIISIMVIAVGISSGISVKTLRRNSNEIQAGQAVNIENSRKAAIMIVTLSII